MNIRKMILTVSLTGAGMMVIGCEHNDDRTASAPPPMPAAGSESRSTMGATNVQPQANVDQSVVDRISTARCDREQSCNNVGEGKNYASSQVCMDQFRGSIGNEINGYNCPHGLDSAAVNECLNAISKEECGVHPVETISRFDKCRSGAMCLK